ncbi:uncharacterized protein METZ01_LOCUS492973, partial [marine metagenome]
VLALIASVQAVFVRRAYGGGHPLGAQQYGGARLLERVKRPDYGLPATHGDCDP